LTATVKPPPKPTRARRLLTGLTGVVSVIGLVTLFGAGTGAALLAHLNLAASRRATADLLGALLADVFQGQINIGSITQVTPGSVEARDIVVRDQAHRIVLKVTRLTANANLLDILLRIVRGDEKLTIVIDHARVERAEADIIPDADGLPTLAHAFYPRPSPAGSASDPSTQYIRVWLPAVEIGQAFARGTILGSPTLETEISGAHGSVLATPKGAAIDVKRFALLARGIGGGDAKGVAGLHIRAPGAVWGTFDGYMGEVQFGSAVRWDKEQLDLKVDVPRAEPRSTRALLADWPLIQNAEVRGRLSGKPPDLKVELNAKVGDHATLASSGTLNTAEPRLALEVEGRKLDLRALWPNAPATAIDVDTDVSVHQANGKLVVDVGGSLAPTTIDALTIPAVEFSGSTSQGTFIGQAKLHDLGLPVDLDFSIFPDGKIELDAEAKRVNLAKVERIKPYFDGTGTADLRVRASIDHGRLDTSLALDVRGLSYGGVALQSGRVSAGAKGSIDKLDQLSLDARLTGKQLSAGRFAFQDVSATARGPMRSPTVTTQLKDPQGPSFDGRAQVTLGDPVSVRRLSLGVSRDNVEIRGDVAQVDLSADRVLVRDLRLHGATGELTGSAELRPDSFSVSARGQNLDLSAISRVLGLPRGQLEGRASLTVDAVASGKTQEGTLELSVNKASLASLSGISGELSAKLSGRRLSGASSGRLESLGAFSADWDTLLAGPPTERGSYESATGRARIALSDVTLDYLGQLLPDTELDVSGTASATLELSRSDPKAVPSLELAAETQGLRLTVPRQNNIPFVLTGIELLGSATHDGSTGNTTVALGAQQGSERLISTSSDITLDLQAALSGKQPLLEQLQTRPLLAKIVVNRLDLDTLPDPLRVPSLHGAVRVEGTVRGTARAPITSLSVRASDLRFSAGDRTEPIDVCGTAEYEKASGAFNVGAELFLPGGFDVRPTPCSGKRIASVHLNGQAPFDFEHGFPAWTGTALATLEQLPLQTIPGFADARVTGNASGSLQLERSSSRASASANLQLNDVRVDRLAMGEGKLRLRSDGDQAHATFEIERGPAVASGSIDAGVTWASQLPALDDAQPIDISLAGTRVEASLLSPFLADFVGELRGTLDGNVKARLAALATGQAGREVEQVTGQMALRDGSFVLTGLGFRLREVGFNATAKRDGKTTIVTVPNFVASAGGKSRSLQANMSFRLLGFEIVSGTAKLHVAQLPLVVDGVKRADANADADLILVRKPEKMLVEVVFDELIARLPEAESRQLIELNENPSVTILQPIAEPKGQRADDDVPWHFVIHLGNKARIERGTAMDIKVAGDPNVVLAQDLGVTGTIFLKRGGAMVLYRKLFVIETGGVIFDTSDPKDPRLDVQASYRTSDGDTLFVYVTGTLTHPEVKFDRPREQAMAVLLKDDASATNLGIGVLDTLIGDTPLARVQLRTQDGSETGDATTYTAAYRVNERFVVEGNYRAGSGGDNAPGDAVPGASAAVDWRVGRNVSVRGQLGTIGTGVELVYQYEY
jgi:hypothetical protein